VPKPRRPAPLAHRFTQVVLALQLCLILALLLTPGHTPARVWLLEMIWAAGQEPAIFTLLALAVGGPLLTLLAWRAPGRHRLVLLLSWAALAVVIAAGFAERFEALLRVMWAHLTR